MDLKLCTKCNKHLDKSNFYSSQKHKDGVYPHCKECRKKQNIINRANKPDYVKNYYQKNKEIILKKNREHTQKRYHENICEMRKYHRNYQTELRRKEEHKDYVKKFKKTTTKEYSTINSKLTNLKYQLKKFLETNSPIINKPLNLKIILAEF